MRNSAILRLADFFEISIDCGLAADHFPHLYF